MKTRLNSNYHQGRDSNKGVGDAMTGDAAAPLLLSEVLKDVHLTMSHVTAIVELALHLEVSTTTDCRDGVNMIQIVIVIEAGITTGGAITVIQVTIQGKKTSLAMTTTTDRDPEIAITIARAITIAIAVDSMRGLARSIISLLKRQCPTERRLKNSRGTLSRGLQFL